MEHHENELQPAAKADHQSIAEEPVARSSQVRVKSPVLASGLGKVGFYFSAAYILFLIAMGLIARDLLLAMKPNEFGDLMSGVFAPLAFLWLVLGFFQQGEELKASVRALELQGEELRHSVEQQRELVAATRDQRELEAAIHQQNMEEATRANAPILRIKGTGSYSPPGQSQLYTFVLSNSGRECFDVVLKLGKFGSREFRQIAAGGQTEFKIPAIPSEDFSEKASVSYLDARGSSGEKHFTLLKDGNAWSTEGLE